MENKKREEGYYWCKLVYRKGWRAMFCNYEGFWFDAGDAYPVLDRHVTEINEQRILPPDESKK